ncbi:unnamed protein product [Pleuronectes platessa]|uniref:Uncharacterized protein n=1 Tax=Pleuronectes platessa TaxID=8262 RepID=A0A9N7VQT1_PLEPL|nr:unnamed protein product [Pleuronectes platessa]
MRAAHSLLNSPSPNRIPISSARERRGEERKERRGRGKMGRGRNVLFTPTRIWSFYSGGWQEKPRGKSGAPRSTTPLDNACLPPALTFRRPCLRGTHRPKCHSKIYSCEHWLLERREAACSQLSYPGHLLTSLQQQHSSGQKLCKTDKHHILIRPCEASAPS